MYRLDFFARNLEFQNLVCTYFSLLYQSVSADNYEKLPFGIMPMLAFGNARL